MNSSVLTRVVSSRLFWQTEKSFVSASVQTMEGKSWFFLMCNVVEQHQWRMNLMEPKGKGLKGLLFEKSTKSELQIQIRKLEMQTFQIKTNKIFLHLYCF